MQESDVPDAHLRSVAPGRTRCPATGPR
jgi:hypothetical protein